MAVTDSDRPSSSRVHWASDIQPTPSGSQRELLELRRGFSNLTRQHKNASAKIDSLREERIALRSKLTNNEKQLALMKRRVSALSGERDSMERERAAEQAHVQKLETKVNAMSNHAKLYDKLNAVKKRHKLVKDENAALKAKLQACAEEQSSQNHEINTLQTALRLKTHEIIEETGKDIPTRLLYAVARSREDGVMLAIQLTDEKEKVRQLTQDLLQTKASLELEERGKADALEVISNKDRKMLSLEAASKSLQTNFERLQTQFDDLRRDCEDKKDEIEALKGTIQEGRDLEARLRDQMHADDMKAVQREKEIRAELIGALEREAAKGEEDRSKSQEEKVSLERQIHSLENDLRDAEYTNQECKLEMDRQRIALQEAEERIQNIVLHADGKENSLKEDVKALDGHCTALNEKCSSLSDELSSTRSEVSFQMQKAEEAYKRAQRAEKMLSEEEQRWQEERAKVIQKLEDTLLQLSGSIEKSDRLERDAAALKAECNVKDNKIQQMIQEMENIRESNNALFKSKELLQRAMLEQVSDVRNRLDQAGVQNKELEATVYRQKETERVLKDMIRSTTASPLVAPHTQTQTQEQEQAQAQAQAQMHHHRHHHPPPHPSHHSSLATGLIGGLSSSGLPAFPSPATTVETPNLTATTATGVGVETEAQLHFPSLEQLAGIDKDVISKLLTPQSAMRLRSL